MASRFLDAMNASTSANIAERLASRFAYIKGQELGLAKPSCPGSSAIEDAKIEMAHDLDWRMRSDSLFSSTTYDSCASPARSTTDRSRSTSPLLRGYQRTSGQTSPNGSFKTIKAYRADVEARELRRELGKLQSGFDMPEEIMAWGLTSLNARSRTSKTPSESLASPSKTFNAIEKPHLEDLLQSKTTDSKKAPAETASFCPSDVERRLFRTGSGEAMRSPASLLPTHGM